jgi:hypothetical protein
MSLGRYYRIAISALALGSASAAVAAQQSGSETAEAPKLICKKSLETGSLVKKTKVCLTREQWARSARGNEQYARELAEDLRPKSAPPIEP